MEVGESRRPPRAVLFACNLNTVRSPMAAALLMRRACGTIYAESCGVWGAGEPDPFVVQVMAEKGIDLAEHRPRPIEAFAGKPFDLIVAMTEESVPRVEEMARRIGAEVERWSIPDPTEAGETRAARLEAYRDVRDQLDRTIKARLQGRLVEAVGR